MEVTLSIVFLNTFQRYCNVTELMHKFRDKIGNFYYDKLAMEELYNFLNNVDSTDIFNIKYEEWVMNYNLEGK